MEAPVHIVDMEAALRYVESMIANDAKGNYVLAMNPEKVIALQRNPSLRTVFNDATLLVPDGVGIVLAIRLLHGLWVSRVPGVDLMQNICEQAAKKGYKIYLYGAEEEVSREAAKKITQVYPGIRIVGRSNGYVSEARMDYLIDDINASRADVLFVALGSPIQERWIAQYLPRLEVKVCQAIGGTLDAIADNIKRAPRLMQNVGLEWFYRLVREPKRIRRQSVLPLFAMKVIKRKIIDNLMV